MIGKLPSQDVLLTQTAHYHKKYVMWHRIYQFIPLSFIKKRMEQNNAVYLGCYAMLSTINIAGKPYCILCGEEKEEDAEFECFTVCMDCMARVQKYRIAMSGILRAADQRGEQNRA